MVTRGQDDLDTEASEGGGSSLAHLEGDYDGEDGAENPADDIEGYSRARGAEGDAGGQPGAGEWARDG